MKSIKVMVLGLLICLIGIFCLILTVGGAGGVTIGGIGYYGFFVGVLVTLVGIGLNDKESEKKSED